MHLTVQECPTTSRAILSAPLLIIVQFLGFRARTILYKGFYNYLLFYLSLPRHWRREGGYSMTSNQCDYTYILARWVAYCLVWPVIFDPDEYILTCKYHFPQLMTFRFVCLIKPDQIHGCFNRWQNVSQTDTTERARFASLQPSQRFLELFIGQLAKRSATIAISGMNTRCNALSVMV